MCGCECVSVTVTPPPAVQVPSIQCHWLPRRSQRPSEYIWPRRSLSQRPPIHIHWPLRQSQRPRIQTWPGRAWMVSTRGGGGSLWTTTGVADTRIEPLPCTMQAGPAAIARPSAKRMLRERIMGVSFGSLTVMSLDPFKAKALVLFPVFLGVSTRAPAPVE